MLPPVESDGHFVQLSSRVGGLARNLIFGKFGFKDGIDADSLTESGIYYLRANTVNALDWSYLIVFKMQEGYLVQINIGIDMENLKLRICSGSSWRVWKKLLLE